MLGFLKIARSEDTFELLKDPKSFALLTLIALRARRNDSFNKYNLEIGEALIGDIKALGLTAREYRTCKDNLSKWGFSTFRTTNRGTIAKLSNTRVFDINEETQRQTERQASDKQKTTNKKDKKEKEDICAEVINYLNLVTGRSFKATTEVTKDLISGRCNEGRTIEDFKKVIDVKFAEWINDPKMSKYLAPDTLFAQSNFEKYLNQSVKKVIPINQTKTLEQVKNLFQ